MKISDVQCQCGTQYRRAQSDTLVGEPGTFICVTCGNPVENWETASKRVYRFIVAPNGAYGTVNPPPAP